MIAELLVKLKKLNISVELEDDKEGRYGPKYRWLTTLDYDINNAPQSAFGSGPTQQESLYAAISYLPPCLKEKL